ncbi:MAG: hypothetical protein ACKOVA_00430 [Novosphingobium sp.]
MNLRFIDWIWHVRGSVPLPAGQTGDEAFARLDPLFHEVGTTYERSSGMLTFSKKDQPAQDKMSVFDSGVLQIEDDAGTPVLRYRLASRALLFCFLVPLLFLAFAQLTIALNAFENPPAAGASPAAKGGDDKKPEVQLNPIDKALGAPEPDKPKDGKDGKGGKPEKKPTPPSAYVFAAIFVFLYGVGRILEDRLVRRLFIRRLQDEAPA